MSERPRTWAAALTVAGSDSGGGAGIQADLKTFRSLRVHGTCAITCVTAQNPVGVTALQACRPLVVRRQIEAVFEAFAPAAVKTGMLYSAALIREVADAMRRHGNVPWVVDPVMVATSGARLLQPNAVRALEDRVFPGAALMTPNLAEAALLGGRPVTSVEAMRQAARRFHQRYGCAVLIKGGHLGGLQEAIDLFYDGQTELLLSAPRIKGVTTHGTGCTYAAAITGYLARGGSQTTAVRRAKDYVTAAIARSVRVGRHWVLG